MAKVVELVVNSVREGITEHDLLQSLSKLYGKPPEHFNALVQQVIGMKQPYTLLKDVQEDVATKHQARLEKIGVNSSLETGLALVPVGGEQDDASPAQDNTPVCPACKEKTTSQAECSNCGVDLSKATSAKQSAEAMKRTLETARADVIEKKKKQELDEEKQRKDKETRAIKEETEKQRKAEAEAKKEVADVFTAEYVDEDESRQRTMKMAGVAAVVAAGVIAWSSGMFSSAPELPPETEASAESVDDTLIDAETADGDTTDSAAESSDAASDTTVSNAAADSDASDSDTTDQPAAAEQSVADAAPAAAPAAGSAQMTQNVVAAATAKAEAGTPGAGAADNFEDVIAKYENKASMQGDNRSAEDVANDLASNMANNKAIFSQIAAKTGSMPGAEGAMQMPSSLAGAAGAAGNWQPSMQASGADLAVGDIVKEMEGQGSINVEEMLARYKPNGGAAIEPGPGASTSATPGADRIYNDDVLNQWVERNNKAKRLTKLVGDLLDQGKPDLANNLVNETSDKWLAIHGHHKIAVVEQLAGKAIDSENRMLDLFVDLMMVRVLPEKIAALADHAETWHLMLQPAQTATAFNQMKSMAEAPMPPRQAIIAHVAMASSLKRAGFTDEAKARYQQSIEAAEKVPTRGAARDEMFHYISLAEASSRFGDEALKHAGRIRDENLRQAALHRMQQIFTRLGMDSHAESALHAAGGSKQNPGGGQAALQNMLKDSGFDLSTLGQ